MLPCGRCRQRAARRFLNLLVQTNELGYYKCNAVCSDHLFR